MWGPLFQRQEKRLSRKILKYKFVFFLLQSFLTFHGGFFFILIFNVVLSKEIFKILNYWLACCHSSWCCVIPVLNANIWAFNLCVESLNYTIPFCRSGMHMYVVLPEKWKLDKVTQMFLFYFLIHAHFTSVFYLHLTEG